MAFVAQIDQPVVTAPSVCVDHRFQIGMIANRRSERGSGDIGDNFCVDAVVSFQQAEDDRFGSRAVTPFAANTPWTEVGLVGFQVAFEGWVPFTFPGPPLTPTQVDRVDAAHRNAGYLGSLGCR